MNTTQDAQLFNIDGLQNALIGLGTKYDPMSANKIKTGYLLDKATLLNLYLSNGVAALIVEKIPEEMTRAGFEIEGISEESKEKLKSQCEELDVLKKYREAIVFARLYGGSAIVYGINDGGSFSQPLRPENVKSVEFLRVYDRHEISEFSRETNPNSKNYGKVNLWAVSPANGSMYIVHHSRMQFFDGTLLPNQERERNNGWGASCLQRCYDEILRVTGSHDFVLQLLNRIQQAVFKMKGLASTLAQPGGESKITKRLNTVDISRSILNTVTVDSEDEYTIETQSVSGVKDVLREFVSLLAAVTGYPVFVLGQSLGGLNSTGDKEAKVWYEKIESEQDFVLKKPLMFLINLMLKTYGETSEVWHIKFNPLAALTENEKAEIDKTESDSLKTKIEAYASAVNNGFCEKENLKDLIEESLGVDNITMPKEAPILKQQKVMANSTDKLKEGNENANEI